jgi:hypothetical protein
MLKVATSGDTPYIKARKEAVCARLNPLTNPPLRRSDDMAKATDNLTQDELKAVLHYDPQTGDFTYLQTRGRRVRGDKAGSMKGDGYWGICINGKHYRAHRLAWFYMTGKWPKVLIDHKNGDPLDNRFDNLREATHAENCQNLKSANKRSGTGLLGVRKQIKPSGDITYQAAIRVQRKFIYLGTYPTAKAAHEVYMEAKRRLHPAYVP